MQKVVGSSPIIRSERPRKRGLRSSPGRTGCNGVRSCHPSRHEGATMSVYRFMLGAIAAALVLSVSPEAQAGGGIVIILCGQTVTTNAVLGHDLFCSGVGMHVGAPGITIDLAGHTLRGDNGVDSGIDDTGGYDKITVKNGVVRNFYDGVRAIDADAVSIANIAVSASQSAGLHMEGDAVSITSSTVTASSSFGIFVAGDALSVKASTVVGNAGIGLEVFGDGAKIASVTASGNSSQGFNVQGDNSSIKSS